MPIIPEFLYHVRHRYDYLTTTTTPPTVQLATGIIRCYNHPDLPDSGHHHRDRAAGAGDGGRGLRLEQPHQRRPRHGGAGGLLHRHHHALRAGQVESERRAQYFCVSCFMPDLCSRKHKELVEENLEVGVMFASKAFVQLIANPFVGRLTNS